MYILGRTQMIPTDSYEEAVRRIMAKGVHNHLVPWEGDMDLKAYLTKLKEIGFDGNASLDVYQYDYEAVAEESVAYLKQVLSEIENEK